MLTTPDDDMMAELDKEMGELEVKPPSPKVRYTVFIHVTLLLGLILRHALKFINHLCFSDFGYVMY